MGCTQSVAAPKMEKLRKCANAQLLGAPGSPASFVVSRSAAHKGEEAFPTNAKSCSIVRVSTLKPLSRQESVDERTADTCCWPNLPQSVSGLADTTQSLLLPVPAASDSRCESCRDAYGLSGESHVVLGAHELTCGGQKRQDW